MIIDYEKFMESICKSVHKSTGTEMLCLNQACSCLAEPIILRVCDISRLLHEAKSKAIEPIKIPYKYPDIAGSWEWGCPKCKFAVGYRWRFCPSCGQEIDWQKYLPDISE